MKFKDVIDITVGRAEGSNRCCVSWKDKDGYRYHVWWFDGREDPEQTIYKNPPGGMGSRRSSTKYLNGEAKVWAPFMDQLIAYVRTNGLRETAELKVAQQAAADAAKAEAENKAHDQRTMDELWARGVRPTGVKQASVWHDGSMSFYDALLLKRLSKTSVEEEIDHG